MTAHNDLDETARPTGQKAPPSDKERIALLVARARELGLDDSRDAAQELMAMIASNEQMVRWQVIDSLAELAARLRRRQRVRLTRALSHGAPMTFDELVSLAAERLRDPSPERLAVAQRVATAEAMGQWQDETVTPVLVEALEQDIAPIVRATAATALGRIQDRQAIDALMTALSDPSFWVRRAAADALGVIGDPRAVPMLRQALAELDETPQRTIERETSASTPVAYDDLDESATLAEGLEPDEAEGRPGAAPETSPGCEISLVKSSLVSALGHMDTARARATLIRYTEDPHPEIRWRAARGLAQVGDASALPALRQLQQDDAVYFGRPISQVATLAIEAINKDERGLGSLIRKGFFFAWHAIRKRVLRRQAQP